MCFLWYVEIGIDGMDGVDGVDGIDGVDGVVGREWWRRIGGGWHELLKQVIVVVDDVVIVGIDINVGFDAGKSLDGGVGRACWWERWYVFHGKLFCWQDWQDWRDPK